MYKTIRNMVFVNMREETTQSVTLPGLNFFAASLSDEGPVTTDGSVRVED